MKPEDHIQVMEFPEPDANGKVRRGYQMGRSTLVRKGGQYRISYKGMSMKRRRFLQDIFQTLVDMKWRYVLLLIFAMFILTYVIFAIIWYLMAYTHGDFEHLGDKSWNPCLVNMRNFADAVLFSIETQSTIGFGTVYPEANCMGTIALLYVQVTIGFLLETILLGFMLVKIARPKNRRKTLVYSSVATIVKEEGELVFQVRLGDLRQSHLVDTKAYGIFIKDKASKEGIQNPLYQHHMEFQAHGMNDKVFLIWPLVLNHRINENSPLFNMGPDEILYANNFEIVVILEGTIESTGEICQARTSYTSKDILWGYRFESIVEFDHDQGKWRANFKLFDNVLLCQTPKCSAREFHQLKMGTGRLENKDICGKPLMRKAFSHKESLSEIESNDTSLVRHLKDSLAESRF